MKFDLWNNAVTINGKKRSLHRVEMLLFIVFMAIYFYWFTSDAVPHISAEDIHKDVQPIPHHTEVSVAEEETKAVQDSSHKSIGEVLASLDEIEADVYSELRKEFTHEVTVAIMGNIYQESRMNPSADAGSKGLFQLEGGRLNNFHTWCNNHGYHYHDHYAQIAYMIREMQSRDMDLRLKGKVSPGNLSAMGVEPLHGGYEQFKNLKDVEVATRVFQATYERAGAPMISQRIKYAYHYDSLIRR